MIHQNLLQRVNVMKMTLKRKYIFTFFNLDIISNNKIEYLLWGVKAAASTFSKSICKPSCSIFAGRYFLSLEIHHKHVFFGIEQNTKHSWKMHCISMWKKNILVQFLGKILFEVILCLELDALPVLLTQCCQRNVCIFYFPLFIYLFFISVIYCFLMGYLLNANVQNTLSESIELMDYQEWTLPLWLIWNMHLAVLPETWWTHMFKCLLLA